MIYKLRFDRFHHMVFDISFNEIEAKLGDVFSLHDTTSMWAEFWQPLEGQFYDDSDKNNVIKLPDIACWFTDDLVLNQKAYKALVDTLSPYGEFLPITVEGIPYWVLHVNKFVDMSAVDEDHSERFIDEAQCVELVRLKFHEAMVEDLLIFKTGFSDYRNIYCTDKFKTLIESLGLIGLVFHTDLVSLF